MKRAGLLINDCTDSGEWKQQTLYSVRRIALILLEVLKGCQVAVIIVW